MSLNYPKEPTLPTAQTTPIREFPFLYNGNFPEGANYHLYSPDGRLIKAINAGYQNLSIEWQLPQLSAGMYVLQLVGDDKVLQTVKVVVQ